MDTFQHEVSEHVVVTKARTPFRHRFFRHDLEREYADRALEVVLLDKGEHDYPDERIVITDIGGGGAQWPYSETWGETLTPDQALRLAEMLEAAAYTLINERAAKVAP